MIIITGDMFTVTLINIDCDEINLVPFKLHNDFAKDYKIIYVLGNH